jgi:predicted site-specific integrase-resolvase
MRGDRAVIYLRVSSKRQATHGFGLELQEEESRKYCEKKGYKLVKIYQDIQSGVNQDRPGLQTMLSELASQNIKVLVCYSQDRLSRDMDDTKSIREKLQANSVRLECANWDDVAPEVAKFEKEMRNFFGREYEELIQNILTTARDALNTGRTWSEADRRSYLEEALASIVKLCEERGANEA